MLEHRAQMKIPADHPCLAGHFPGHPVVPAVLLLDCVAQALSAALGRTAVLRGIPSAKFLSPLIPEQDFTIELHIEPERATAAGDAREESKTPGRGHSKMDPGTRAPRIALALGTARFRCVAGGLERVQGRLEFRHEGRHDA